MKEFGGVSRRDSEVRYAVARRIKRRRQWQVVQGETCESGAKVDRGHMNQRAPAPVKPVRLPTKTEGKTARSRLELGECRLASR